MIGDLSVGRRAPAQLRKHSIAVPAVAWFVSLVAVGLPHVVADLIGLAIPQWLTFVGPAVALAAMVGSLVLAALRPFAAYFLVLLIMQLAIQSSLWPNAIVSLGIQLPAGSAALGGELMRELAVALLVVAALAATGYRGTDSFLALGRLRAPAKPVRGLIDRPMSWAKLGPLSALAIAAGTLTFVALAGVGAPDVGRIAAMLPGVAVVAGLNAFNEEVVFRAAPVATLRRLLGERQTVALVVALFAVPHYFGVPFGVVGMLMAGAFAWWVTKSLLETRGLFWAWLIHALQDVVIFSFLMTGAPG